MGSQRQIIQLAFPRASRAYQIQAVPKKRMILELGLVPFKPAKQKQREQKGVT